MKESKLKVLVTGGSGFLTNSICKYRANSWDLYILTRGRQNVHQQNHFQITDYCDRERLHEVFSLVRPDLIINTVSLANVELCEQDPQEATKANVQSAEAIAWAAKNCHSKLVHISTDHYAKQDKLYSLEEEFDPPLNIYAKTKMDADLLVSQINPDALIIKTNFFDWGTSSKQSFSDFILKNLRSSTSITLFDDVYYNPIHSEYLVDSIEALAEANEKSYFNVATNRRITKYEFGILLCSQFKLDHQNIKKGYIKSTSLAKRPLNMCLSNRKLIERLGPSYDFTIEDSIERLRKTELNWSPQFSSNQIEPGLT